jgi:hypothetical protein
METWRRSSLGPPASTAWSTQDRSGVERAPLLPAASHHDLLRSSCPPLEFSKDERLLTHGVGDVSATLAGERAPSRRSHRVSDPPSDTNAEGAAGGSTREPPAAPPDPAVQEASAGWRREGTPAPTPARIPRLLFDLYRAVHDLGSAGAVRNARAALVEQKRDADELTRIGTLVERAVGHATVSEPSAHGPSR